jgi:type III restriction enzyme
MPSFSAKDYQRSCLESVEKYFTKCQELGDADWAFQKTTEELWGEKSHFTPLKGEFPSKMPYFCLRVPTGGGKCLFVMATDKDWQVISEKMG